MIKLLVYAPVEKGPRGQLFVCVSEENPSKTGTVSKSSDFWRMKSLDSEITKLAILSVMHSDFGV